jgi:hypothetical protein
MFGRKKRTRKIWSPDQLGDIIALATILLFASPLCVSREKQKPWPYILSSEYIENRNQWSKNKCVPIRRTEALFAFKPNEIENIDSNRNLLHLMNGKCPNGIDLSVRDQFSLARLMTEDVQSGLDANKITACYTFEAWAVYLLGFKFDDSRPLWRKLAKHLRGNIRKESIDQPMIGKTKNSIGWEKTTHEAFFLKCLALKCGKKYASIEDWAKNSGPYPGWIDNLEFDPREKCERGKLPA